MEEPAELNPYAPSAVAPSENPLAAIGVGCWRHGTLLVVHEDAELPPICVKTGREAVAYRPSLALDARSAVASRIYRSGRSALGKTAILAEQRP